MSAIASRLPDSQCICHCLISLRCYDELDADASPLVNTPGHREPHYLSFALAREYNGAL